MYMRDIVWHGITHLGTQHIAYAKHNTNTHRKYIWDTVQPTVRLFLFQCLTLGNGMDDDHQRKTLWYTFVTISADEAIVDSITNPFRIHKFTKQLFQ